MSYFRTFKSYSKVWCDAKPFNLNAIYPHHKHNLNSIVREASEKGETTRITNLGNVQSWTNQMMKTWTLNDPWIWIKLGQIIRLRNVIQKYLVFVSLFGTQIGSKQASLFVLYKKQIPFLRLNTGYFEPFWHLFCTTRHEQIIIRFESTFPI